MKDRAPNSQDEMYRQLRDKGLFELAKAHAYAYIDAVENRNVFPMPGDRSGGKRQLGCI